MLENTPRAVELHVIDVIELGLPQVRKKMGSQGISPRSINKKYFSFFEEKVVEFNGLGSKR